MGLNEDPPQYELLEQGYNAAGEVAGKPRRCPVLWRATAREMARYWYALAGAWLVFAVALAWHTHIFAWPALYSTLYELADIFVLLASVVFAVYVTATVADRAVLRAHRGQRWQETYSPDTLVEIRNVLYTVVFFASVFFCAVSTVTAMIMLANPCKIPVLVRLPPRADGPVTAEFTDVEDPHLDYSVFILDRDPAGASARLRWKHSLAPTAIHYNFSAGTAASDFGPGFTASLQLAGKLNASVAESVLVFDYGRANVSLDAAFRTGAGGELVPLVRPMGCADERTVLKVCATSFSSGDTSDQRAWPSILFALGLLMRDFAGSPAAYCSSK